MEYKNFASPPEKQPKAIPVMVTLLLLTLCGYALCMLLLQP